MPDVGKPGTQTSAGARGVPHRRLKTLTSVPLLAAVDDGQRISDPSLRHSSKMSIPPALQTECVLFGNGVWRTQTRDYSNVETVSGESAASHAAAQAGPSLTRRPRHGS